MSAKAIHMNLLQPAERLSSSPVRVKVMLPVVAGVILAAMILWWVFLLLQQGLVTSETGDARSRLSATEASYAAACKVKATLQAKEAELWQLKGFLNSRRTWGRTLAAVATELPAGIQLTAIEIPEPPPQNLNPPPGIRLPPLLGPTNDLEAVTFRIAGKTALESHVFSFLKSVASLSSFTNNLDAANHRMRQFGQDKMTDEAGNRAIVFDVEYPTAGRRFAP